MTSDVLHFPVRTTDKKQAKHKGLPEFLKRFDQPGPRYTSYPTIDQCGELTGEEAYVQALQGRCLGGLQRPLSLYIHVPFCSSVCYYCACNKVITRKRDQVQQYMDSLVREAEWVVGNCKSMTPVMQFHMGGGTPTFLNDSELAELLRRLESLFEFSPRAERSIEVDPRTVDSGRLKNLRTLGFNRISFGVQDFNPAVQKAVHREQSFESVQALVHEARKVGFESINVDLIYGLPLQTVETFKETIAKLIEVDPDRVALYSYAHLPERFKPQRRIHVEDLPDAAAKVDILAGAIEAMQQAGYEYIGMDHFAKPGDALSKARRHGNLHRNFQGYTTQPDADLIGLGVSAISKVGPALLQNTRDLEEYTYAVQHTGNATFRGHVSDRDDLIRYSVIMSILCQGEVNFLDFLHTQWVTFQSYFGPEMDALRSFEAQGLLTMSESGVQLTETGWFFVRPIAMVFDKYLQRSNVQRSKVL